MLAPGNPYVLPATLLGVVAYLAVTLLTDASLLARIGLLALFVGVVPTVLNRLLSGGDSEDAPTDDAEELSEN